MGNRKGSNLNSLTFDTPEVPNEIMALRHREYKNVFEFELGNKNLWGTESLLGDWNGHTLLVAKDFYPASYLMERAHLGAAAYTHNPSAPTNKNLMKTLNYFDSFSVGSSNHDCGFLYISACFLLRNDGKIRGQLPSMEQALRTSEPAVSFTVKKMRNLRRVVLMGNEAKLASEYFSIFRAIRKMGVIFHSTSHPSRALSDSDRFAEWEFLSW